MHRQEGIGLKRREACWVQIITLGGQKCMVSLWTDKIVQNVSNKLGLGGTFVLIYVLLDVFMITVLDLTAEGERAHLFPLFTTSIPQISVWSAVRYLQLINSILTFFFFFFWMFSFSRPANLTATLVPTSATFWEGWCKLWEITLGLEETWRKWGKGGQGSPCPSPWLFWICQRSLLHSRYRWEGSYFRPYFRWASTFVGPPFIPQID